MKVNFKEIKNRAKTTIKSHYLMFVIGLLLCAMLGVDYTFSTYSFSLLKGGNEETYNEISETISDSAYINEKGDIVINNSASDVSNDLAEDLYKVITKSISESRAGKMADVAVNGPTEKTLPDEQYGFITASYKNGVLASVINSVKSGSFMLSILNNVSNVVKNPSVATILTLIIGILILIADKLFIDNFIWLSTKRMFITAQTYSSTTPGIYLFLLRKNIYFRALFAYFVKQVYQILWNLTIVGGIIKEFSYAMVPYIIAENPTIKPNEAITLSRKMMYGHKWELFVFSLTFIGWELLNVLTLGLVGLFWLNPYIESSKAGYYLVLREEYIKNKGEGYELLNDEYLTRVPTEEELAPAYGTIIADAKHRLETEERLKYTGVAGFFANYLGIVLHYNEKANKINQQKEDEELIERYNLIVEGKAYPVCLHPSNKKRTKIPRFYTMHYLKKYSVLNIVAMFFIGCIVGWLWEVGIHLVEDGMFINRGVLHGPWLPIYGTGATMILIILYKFRDKVWLEFILAMVLSGIVEYITSYFLEVTHNGQKWWDYTGYFLNINGRVCAEGLLVFGVAGVAFVYFLAPIFDSLLKRVPIKVLIPILSVLIVLFIADNIYSRSHPNTGKGITDYGEAKQETSAPENTTNTTGMQGDEGLVSFQNGRALYKVRS